MTTADDSNEDLALWAAEVNRAQQERRALVESQGLLEVSDAIEALLFARDPIGINFGKNTDEYRMEAETITLRLPQAVNSSQATRIVYEEFVSWFGAEEAGDEDRYVEIAAEIWGRWTSARAGGSRGLP